MDKTVLKVSDTEVEIIETIPEVPAIPAKQIRTKVSLADLKAKMPVLEAKIVEWTGYRDTPLKERQEKLNEIEAELAKIDKQIADLNKEKADIEAQIVEAEKQGVKDTLDVKPVEEPVELPVEGTIIKG